MTGPLFGPSPNQFHHQVLSGVRGDGESAIDLPTDRHCPSPYGWGEVRIRPDRDKSRWKEEKSHGPYTQKGPRGGGPCRVELVLTSSLRATAPPPATRAQAHEAETEQGQGRGFGD